MTVNVGKQARTVSCRTYKQMQAKATTACSQQLARSTEAH